MRMIRSQRGFTLIEIVMVIVLLGIIAAIAIPQYIDLRQEAQDATADGVVGAIVSSAAIGYADRAVHNTSPVTYPSRDDLNNTYMRVQKISLLNAGAAAWTATIGGHTYTFTYSQNNGGATFLRAP
jgi:prepilin-type N-terminal cleavage/methylation domain-containing protein